VVLQLGIWASSYYELFEINRDYLASFLSIFSLEYSIQKVKESKESLTLKGKHQFLIYAHGINVLGERICAIKNRRFISR
jgi:hypothetical protein